MVDQADKFSVETELLARLCIEYWKLSRACLKAVSQLPEKDGQRLAAQVKFSDLQLSTIGRRIGIRVISFDGEEYTPGMAASADNSNDYPEDDTLVVVKTIEPAIVHDMKVLSKGRVLIGRADEEKREE